MKINVSWRKKVLSLVLCVAVMLSVMVMGAGAAFSDQDKIENTEAVNMCSALNIIGGYEDGSFHPERNIKRSEITKMICVALNGGREPNVSTNTVPTFSDVRGTSAAWAEGYIESCVAQGIVSGVGGGRFAPNGNVTGAQLAKMLLVALGYNSDNEGFTGNAWETNVNVRASQKGLYAGLESMDTSAAVTRDQAAQMVWNALNAYEVEYKTTLVTDANGQLVSQITVQDKVVGTTNDKITLLEDTYGVYCVEGIVVANEYVTLADTKDKNTALAEGKTDIQVTNADAFEDGKKLSINDGGSNVFSVSTGADEIGKAVALFVKPDSNSTSTTKATVVGGAVLNGNVVLTANGPWDNQTDMNAALKDAGLKTALPAAYYVNGVKTAAAVDNSVMKNGYATQFIDNDDDGTVDYVLVNKTDLGKVTAYSTKDDGSITIESNGVSVKYKDSADVVGFADVAKDDYVLFSEVGGSLYVEKAQSVSGVLTDYSNQGTAGGVVSLWVDGTEYENSGATRSDDLLNPVGYTALDKTAIFYLDACGYIAGVDGTSVKEYAIATYYNANAQDEDGVTTSARAKVTFEDGTAGSPVVAALENDAGKTWDNTLNTDNYAVNAQLGSYSYDENDKLVLDVTGVLFVNDKTFEYTSGNVLVKYDSKNLTDDGKTATGDTVYMTDSTVLFVVDTKDGGAIDSTQVDKVTTYVGKDNMPSMELSSGYMVKYIVNDDNEIEAMAVISSGLSAVTDNYLYVIDVTSTATDTKKVKVVLDNEIKEITVNSKKAESISKGLNEYAVDETGNYDLKKITSDIVSGTVNKVNTNNNTIVVGGIEYGILDTTDIANITEEDVLTLAEVQVGDNVTVLKNSDGDALGIYVLFAADGDSNALNDALNRDNQTLNGEVPHGNIAVPAGLVLTLGDGAEISAGTTFSGDGKVEMGDVTISGTADMSEATVSVDGNVTVADGGALTIAAEPAKRPTGSGTLTVAAGGALAVDEVADTDSSKTLIGTVDARIITKGDTSVTVNFNGAGELATMTIAGNAEIPAGQTWYAMFGPEAATATELDMKVTSGTLTVNGTLKLIKGTTGSSLTVSGAGKVVVGTNGLINVASLANLIGNNAVVGTDATSKLTVADGNGTISDVNGVSDHNANAYTWDSEKSTWTTGA